MSATLLGAGEHKDDKDNIPVSRLFCVAGKVRIVFIFLNG